MKRPRLKLSDILKHKMKLIFLGVLIICLIGLIKTASVKNTEATSVEEIQTHCGYQTCEKSDPHKMNIHLVAHTHDDVGWLKTIDQYYYGENNDIQIACVRQIINSVLDALVKDPNRKFIYVEMAYLWKWWILQNETQRDTMRTLINEGRLEIIGGGWSMPDEATSHYHSLIDQYTWGFRRLKDTFGECARPKIGWQIDPFGHSREQASIFSQLGFDGLLFGRLDYQDFEQRIKTKTTEFIWKSSPNLGDSANLFTSVLYHLYQPPDGFCFDTLCGSIGIVDDPNDPNYNLDMMVVQFLNFVDRQAKSYVTNNIIITMGGDFNYQNAEMYYTSIDRLIRGINKQRGDKYKAFYSTPSCYLKAVNEHGGTWPTKSDDFFPYASGPNTYWTGYYSSRPTVKYFERMGNNFLQVVKQLTFLSDTDDSPALEQYREAMGVLQHHDAVTGTEKQDVSDDYIKTLHRSIKNAEQLASDALRKLTAKTAAHQDNTDAKFESCLLLNVSSCDYTSKAAKFIVTVYNPTSQPLDTYVRLPIANLKYTVRDYNGKEVVSQIVPIPKVLLLLPGRVSNSVQELVFRASKIAPLGYQSFYVDHASSVPFRQGVSTNESVEINTQEYKISVNERKNIVVRAPFGIEYEQTFEYYESKVGTNVGGNHSSGAYMFRPAGNSSRRMNSTSINFEVYKGPLLEEIHQVVNDWVSQVVRIYKQENHVEFDWMVGPIPIGDYKGKEVVTKYSSNIRNNEVFYTDSNGREMLKRQLNYRPTWDLQLDEKISANYYPVTAKITIEDEANGHRMSVLNDRAQGGTSLTDGEIELMVHRRTLYDDGFGVDEPLDEEAYGRGLVARGRHVVITGDMDNPDELILKEKEEAVKLALKPWIFITPTSSLFRDWNEHHHMIGAGLIGKLPKNIRILTLEPWKDGSVLLRLEHLFELGEAPQYSVTTELSIKELFPKFNVISVNETTLGANQIKEFNKRLQWTLKDDNENSNVQGDSTKQTIDTSNFVISLKPMEIRTFIVKVSKSSS